MSSWAPAWVAIALLAWAPAALADELEAAAAAEPSAGAEAPDSAEPAAEAEPPDADQLAREARALEDRTEALERLRAMSDFLAGQQSFRFAAEIAWDALQRTGQKLEFGGSRRTTVRRPDRLRVRIKGRDGEAQTLRFDGRWISLWIPDENAYVSVEKPGTIDELLEYLIEDLGVPAPLADFVYSDPHGGVADRIATAMVVGDETIAGVAAVHLDFTMQDVDFQLWVATGAEPVPVRLVIDYKRAPGRPQFRAGLSQWSFGIDAPDELFTFVPPEGAEQIPLAAARQRREQRPEPEGGEW